MSAKPSWNDYHQHLKRTGKLYICLCRINTIFSLFSSIVEEHQKHIEQLQQTLFEKDNERNSLNQRLNELELELQKTIDDHTSKKIHSEEQ